MRKFIIDSDTGSDDAVAIMMGLLTNEVEVLGLTTVCGNISLEMATANALMTKEICGSDVEVYPGLEKPLLRKRVETASVHGADGMGDMGLINPKTKANEKHAVDFILETIKANPGEIEIIALGPVTNIALAILKEPKVMRQVKRIWSMGTGGFGPGNATPVAEFNVFIDADSYKIMLESNIPITIMGFDICLGDASLYSDDLAKLRALNDVGKFAADCTTALLNYNEKALGEKVVNLPDAVAIGVALWDEIVLDKADCNCYCCTTEPQTYGQVVIADSKVHYEATDNDYDDINATVIKKIDCELFISKMMELLGTAK